MSTSQPKSEAMKTKRHLVAILFTDINHHDFATELADPEIITLRKQYHETLITFHKEFKGRIVNFFGHGSVSVFRCALDAMRCARGMQQQFQEQKIVKVRMGLHVGEVLKENADITGTCINVAARIQAIGVPGSVLFSDFVYAQIRNQPEFDVASLGMFSMKNISEKVHVYALKEKDLVVPSRIEILKLQHTDEIPSRLRGPMQALPVVCRVFLAYIYSSLWVLGVILIV